MFCCCQTRPNCHERDEKFSCKRKRVWRKNLSKHPYSAGSCKTVCVDSVLNSTVKGKETCTPPRPEHYKAQSPVLFSSAKFLERAEDSTNIQQPCHNETWMEVLADTSRSFVSKAEWIAINLEMLPNQLPANNLATAGLTLRGDSKLLLIL